MYSILLHERKLDLRSLIYVAGIDFIYFVQHIFLSTHVFVHIVLVGLLRCRAGLRQTCLFNTHIALETESVAKKNTA